MVARTTMICCLLVLGVLAAPSVAVPPPAPVTALVARFEVSSDGSGTSLLVNFRDTSAGEPISWRWNFGEKNGTSAQRNPEHTYQKRGTYEVTLAVTNRLGSTATKSQTFGVPLEVQFTKNKTTGSAPLSVTFTNQSVGQLAGWRWDFGDGHTSTEKDRPSKVSHTYDKAGTYTIILTATNRAGLTMSAVQKVSVT